MPTRKIIIAIILLVLLSALGFYLFNKSRTSKTIDRVYTNEKVTESEGKLAEGFPEVPVYPGLTLDKSYRREQDGKVDFSAFWYYSFEEEKIPEVMKWYIDELNKSGWKASGPFIDESEEELAVTAENSKYKLRIYNSERYEEDSAGRPGNIISASIVEK